MERIGCKYFLKMEWTFSTTSQTILEMVVRHKNEYENGLFFMVIGSRAILVNGWRKWVNVGIMCPFLYESSGVC